MSLVMHFRRLPAYGDDIPLPTYATSGAAAFDLRAAIPPDEIVVIEPGGRMLVDTGLAVAVPPGHEMQIRPRSGLAAKHGVTVLNSPGTVDEDFRGQVQIALINLGSEPFSIVRGDRVAQALIAPVTRVSLLEVGSLDETPRGRHGFGSTGVA